MAVRHLHTRRGPDQKKQLKPAPEPEKRELLERFWRKAESRRALSRAAQRVEQGVNSITRRSPGSPRTKGEKNMDALAGPGGAEDESARQMALKKKRGHPGRDAYATIEAGGGECSFGGNSRSQESRVFLKKRPEATQGFGT